MKQNRTATQKFFSRIRRHKIRRLSQTKKESIAFTVAMTVMSL